MENKILLLKRVFTFVLTLTLAGSLSAATAIWTGAGDGSNWEDKDNWSTLAVPTADDHVRVEGSANVTINDPGAVANSVRVKDDSELTIAMGADLTVAENNDKGGAVRVVADARLTNNGSLFITLSEDDYLYMSARSEVVNNGLIHITTDDDDCCYDAVELNNQAHLLNNGTLRTDDSESNGMDINDRSSVHNYGDILINDPETEGANMDDRSSFYNYGHYEVQGVDGNDGICMDDNNSYFENSGTIYIAHTGDGTGEGIEVDDGVFINLPSGVIDLVDVPGDGLAIETRGEIFNEGIININMIDEEDDDSENAAIEIENNATLFNSNLITVVIEDDEEINNVDLEGNNARLINDECGKIDFQSEYPFEINNNAVFLNDGFIAIPFSGTHDNDGTLENNGKISAPNGFSIAPNAVTGTGEIGDFPFATLPCPWELSNVDCEGSASFDKEGETFTISSSACHNSATELDDEYAFVSQTLCGDGEISVQVSSISGSLGWAGVQMRESGDADAKMVSLMTSRSTSHRKEVRTMTGGVAFSQMSPSLGRHWLRLERIGNSFNGYSSLDGNMWFLKFSQQVPMDACLEVGMVVNSMVGSGETTATFANVSIDGGGMMMIQTAPPATNPEVTITDEATKTFSVFPNPTNGVSTVDLSAYYEQRGVLEVLNANGKLMEQIELGVIERSTEQLNLSGYPAGLYLVKLTLADGTESIQRVVVQR